MKIEAFVEKKEVITGQAIMGRPISDGVGTHYCTAHETLKTEQILSEESMRVFDEATKKATELGCHVVVYNLSSLRGRLAARVKGIKSVTWRIVE